MNSLSVLAIPTAIALLLASAASTAQDKPNTVTAKKPSASVSNSSKAAKATAQTPAQSNSRSVKALNEGGGATQSAPAATVPAAKQVDESCHHGKGSDA